jgi:hypothetical protein
MSDPREPTPDHPSHASDDVMAESVDEVEFAYPTDRLARRRPPRKPLEPGFGRTLTLAALAGVGLGVGAYFFKPEPRNAIASPPNPDAPVRHYAEPKGLFELPEWDEAAYRRDVEAGKAPAR